MCPHHDYLFYRCGRNRLVSVHRNAHASRLAEIMSYRHILTDIRGHVALVRFNRPEVRNALCEAMIAELAATLDAFEADDAVGAIVVTGDNRAFAAGADIGEMAKL